MRATEPSREQLEMALHISRLTCSLDEALQFPALATALRITAAVLAAQAQSGDLKTRLRHHVPRDWQALAANDNPSLD